MTFHLFSIIHINTCLDDLDFLEALMNYLEAQDDWVAQQHSHASIHGTNEANFAQVFVTTDTPYKLCLKEAWRSRGSQAMWARSKEHQRASEPLAAYCSTADAIYERLFLEETDDPRPVSCVPPGEGLFGFHLIQLYASEQQADDRQYAGVRQALEMDPSAVLFELEMVPSDGKALLVCAESEDSLSQTAGILSELALGNARTHRFVRLEDCTSHLEASWEGLLPTREASVLL